MQYLIDPIQLQLYLAKRFKRMMITSGIIIVLIVANFAYIMYKRDELDAMWTFCVSVPWMYGALWLGITLWNKKLSKLAGTEFILAENSLVQKTVNGATKQFNYSEIAVISKTTMGTDIVKGNWLTKVDYYRPKKSSYKADDPNLIFIPTVTTHYKELIQQLKQKKKAPAANL